MFDTAQVGFGQNEVHSLMLLVTFLGAAVLCDLQDRRVPNVLVALMLVAGVVTQALTAPSIGSGLLAAFGGAGIGLCMLLPFYALGGMGAGDVKLFAATGSFLGLHQTLLAGLCTLGTGAVLGLILIALRAIQAAAWARGPVELASADGTPIQLPYSLAISIGVLTAVIAW